MPPVDKATPHRGFKKPRLTEKSQTSEAQLFHASFRDVSL